MKMVYTRENRLMVSNAQNILVAAGIEVLLKNEYAAGAAGDLSPFDTWMELWVQTKDYERARGILDDAFEQPEHPDWACDNCNETNAATFELCWNCQEDRSHRDQE